jgi:hypothetical protein
MTSIGDTTEPEARTGAPLPVAVRWMAALGLVMLSAGLLLACMHWAGEIAGARARAQRIPSQEPTEDTRNSGSAGLAWGALPDLADLRYHVHGGTAPSRLEIMVQTDMKPYFSANLDPRDLSPEEQADLDAVLAWCRNGAPEAEFWDSETKKPGRILGIFSLNGCLDCHHPEAQGRDAFPQSPLDTYASVQRHTARWRPGTDLGSMLRDGHQILLMLALLYGVCGAASLCAPLPGWAHTLNLALGFLALGAATGGWYASWAWGGGWTGLHAGGALATVVCLTWLTGMGLWGIFFAQSGVGGKRSAQGCPSNQALAAPRDSTAP